MIGGDTAGEGSDWFVGRCWITSTGEQVAVLRHQMEEDVYAGRYTAWACTTTRPAGIESNFSTYPNKELHRLGYKMLFVREVEDDYTGKIRHAFGFRTDSVTRPGIIGGSSRRCGNGSEYQRRDDAFRDADLCEEREAAAGGEPGAHDDTQSWRSRLRTTYGRSRDERTGCREEESARRKWSKTMWGGL